MSTRSNIAILEKNGTITATYHHFDGYLSGVGQDLLEGYNSEELAREAVRHSMHTESTDMIRVYEDDGAFREHLRDSDAEYAYLWKDNEWKYIKVEWSKPNTMEWTSVKKALEEEATS